MTISFLYKSVLEAESISITELFILNVMYLHTSRDYTIDKS
jgi:hypothetical protein